MEHHHESRDPDDVTVIRIDVRVSPPEQVSGPVDTLFGKEYTELAAAAVLIQRTYRGWTVRMVRFGEERYYGGNTSMPFRAGNMSLQWYNREDPNNRRGQNGGEWSAGEWYMRDWSTREWSARQSASQRYQEDCKSWYRWRYQD